jgi:hypothetical protein
MPNLEHDPQNPTDLLDRPIAVGDIVAWGTTWGKSPALCVAHIERIRFIRKGGSWNSYSGNVEVPQQQADDYQLVLRPIKSTGRVSVKDLADPSRSSWQIDLGEIRDDPGRFEVKTKTVHHVKNIVKLEPLSNGD